MLLGIFNDVVSLSSGDERQTAEIIGRYLVDVIRMSVYVMDMEKFFSVLEGMNGMQFVVLFLGIGAFISWGIPKIEQLKEWFDKMYKRKKKCRICVVAGGELCGVGTRRFF